MRTKGCGCEHTNSPNQEVCCVRETDCQMRESLCLSLFAAVVFAAAATSSSSSFCSQMEIAFGKRTKRQKENRISYANNFAASLLLTAADADAADQKDISVGAVPSIWDEVRDSKLANTGLRLRLIQFWYNNWDEGTPDDGGGRSV